MQPTEQAAVDALAAHLQATMGQHAMTATAGGQTAIDWKALAAKLISALPQIIGVLLPLFGGQAPQAAP